MKRSISLIIAILLLAPTLLPLHQSESDGSFVISNVTVIPMDSERVLKDRSVVIENGVITVVGPAAKVKTPPGARVIDGKGKYLIPGLFDMHIHIREGQESDLTLYAANGVTTVQSMHGSPWHLELRKRIAEGELLGPRFFTTGPTTATARVDSPEKARKFVIEQKKAGYDAIKQYGDGSNSMTRETYNALLRTAREQGIRVVGHAPRNMGFSAVLEERQDSIDHAEEIYYTYEPIQDLYKPHVDFQFGRMSLEDYRKADPPFPSKDRIPPVVDRLAKDAKAAGLAFTPTLITFETIWKQTTDHFDELMNQPELKYVEPLTRASWGPRVNRYRAGWSNRLAEMDRMLKKSLELQEKTVKAFDDAGVPVMAGTDAPLTFIYPGFALHDELAKFVEAGLSPYRALRAATVTPAEFLGISGKTGTVEKGKAADLVLLDANPLGDISNTRRIAGVFVNGRWIPKSEIDSKLNRIADSYAPFWEEISVYEGYFDKGETRKALEAYRASKNKSERLAGYLERTVNGLGYSHLRADEIDKALEVFRLNTEFFPEAFNTWDSLAEAHMVKGDKELAIRYYRKSLELNPQNNNAVEQLKKLGAGN